MKTRLFLLSLTLATGVVARAAPVAPTPAESAQIRRQIDALLKLRLSPAPLPVDPPNPFTLATGGSVSTATPVAPVAPDPMPAVDFKGEEDAELLARYASRLHITGMIRVKGQVHVIINDSPWKEGDFIIVSREPRLVQLQVGRIQPGQLTLKLEDAELVLRF